MFEPKQRHYNSSNNRKVVYIEPELWKIIEKEAELFTANNETAALRRILRKYREVIVNGGFKQ